MRGIVTMLLAVYASTAIAAACNCSRTWRPVCWVGKNVPSVTYMNECFANCTCDVFPERPCEENWPGVAQGVCPQDDVNNPVLDPSLGCPAGVPSHISASHAWYLQQQGTFDYIWDTRTGTEFAGDGEEAKEQIGHVTGARLAENLQTNASTVPSLRGCRNSTILLVCRSGSRTTRAMALLRANGFNCVYSMDGGTQQWAHAGFDVSFGAWDYTRPTCPIPAAAAGAVVNIYLLVLAAGVIASVLA